MSAEMPHESGRYAYAVSTCSRELLATTEGRRMMEEQLLVKVSELGAVIPLTAKFTVDPWERHGDLDAPMSTPTQAVMKLACQIVAPVRLEALDGDR